MDTWGIYTTKNHDHHHHFQNGRLEGAKLQLCEFIGLAAAESPRDFQTCGSFLWSDMGRLDPRNG